MRFIKSICAKLNLEDFFELGLSLGLLDSALLVASEFVLGSKGGWEGILDLEEASKVENVGISIHPV